MALDEAGWTGRGKGGVVHLSERRMLLSSSLAEPGECRLLHDAGNCCVILFMLNKYGQPTLYSYKTVVNHHASDAHNCLIDVYINEARSECYTAFGAAKTVISA